MATRGRKRIHALRRAPDGSAFGKCEDCGVAVAIALLDMHECESKKWVQKRIRVYEEEDEWGPKFDDQPRSPFCFFMETFKKTCNTGNFIERSRKGFNVWKDMSEEERYPYVVLAEKVNSAYDHILLEESNNMEEEDDEADSAMVGKFDTVLGGYKALPNYRKFRRSEAGYKDPLNYIGSANFKNLKRADWLYANESDDWESWFNDQAL